MKPELKLVGGMESNLPDPPFPADMRAQGWRFELDYERIETSDTWALARNDLKPWLLMLWFKAWQQTPIGSLPNEDEIIAAKIGIELTLFQAYRHILLRGWNLHSDGRLYHTVIIETADRMLQRNLKNAEKQRVYRNKAASNRNVTVTLPAVTHQNQNQNHIKESASRSSIGKPILSADADAPPASASPEEQKTACPYREIRQLWLEIFPTLASPVEVEKWGATRKNRLRAHWKQHPSLNWWRGFFAYLKESDFLMGRKKDFQMNLDWVLNPANFIKCQEGCYDNA